MRTPMLNFRASPSLIAALTRLADARGTSRSDELRRAAEAHVEAYEDDEPAGNGLASQHSPRMAARDAT